jgi:hypothetical protein
VQCTEALTNVFYGAVKLLKDFEGGTDRSWKESFEITRKKYSESTINEFIDIPRRSMPLSRKQLSASRWLSWIAHRQRTTSAWSCATRWLTLSRRSSGRRR